MQYRICEINAKASFDMNFSELGESKEVVSSQHVNLNPEKGIGIVMPDLLCCEIAVAVWKALRR